MSAKLYMSPNPIVTNASMAATITSEPCDIRTMDLLALSLQFTGSPVGTFDIQVSEDYQPNMSTAYTPINPGTWISIVSSLSSAPVASGSAGNIVINLPLLATAYLRVVYNPTSGTGNLNAFVSGKGL